MPQCCTDRASGKGEPSVAFPPFVVSPNCTENCIALTAGAEYSSRPTKALRAHSWALLHCAVWKSTKSSQNTVSLGLTTSRKKPKHKLRISKDQRIGSAPRTGSDQALGTLSHQKRKPRTSGPASSQGRSSVQISEMRL